METMMMRMTQIMHALKNNDNESKYMYLYPKVMQCLITDELEFLNVKLNDLFIHV